MFKNFIKLLLLFLFSFTHFLYADEVYIPIHVSNPTVNEADKTITFIISLDNAPLSFLGMNVKYQTRNGSASFSSDYEKKGGGFFDFLHFSKGKSSRKLTLDIYEDTQYEGEENFYLDVSTSAKGYQKNATGKGTITDNDVDNSLKVEASCDDVKEGNIAESNNIECTISLNRTLLTTESDLTIHYDSSDGDDTPSAKANEDYHPITGDITFHQGEKKKTIYIPTIGDNDIEEDENVKLIISGSSYITDSEGDGWILNDDGKFPGITFNSKEFSIIEGNSSQKMLDFNFTLAKPALAGASFTYDTWDGSAEDQSKDNDYIWTHGEYNLTVGEQNISISVPINGDTKKEEDEYFHFGIDNLKKLTLNGSDEAVGTIINDDGSYPTISIDDVKITEGDSGTKTMTFTVSLDKPAGTGVTFDYAVFEGDNSNSKYNAEKKSDFLDELNTTVVLEGNVTSSTISITINGDTEIEEDEEFFILLSNAIDGKIIKEKGIGTIINDDFENKPFTCSEKSYLFTSDQTAKYTDYYSINLSTGIAKNEKRFGTSHINATGYNVKDDYIYGFEYGNDDESDTLNSYNVVRINSNFEIERLNILGLSKTRFYLGDVSMDGIYYLANRHQPIDNSTLQEIQRVDLNTSTLMSKITLQYDNNTTKIKTSDFAFNPKDNQLYMVNAENNQLIRVNKDSGQVEELGYVGNIGDTYSVISFFDVDGNFYFYTKGTEKIYKIDISNPASIDATAHEFNNMKGLINSGDGARCANAPVTPPIKDNTPLVCDSSMYLSSSIKRGDSTKGTGKMWLHKIDTQKNPFAFNVVDDDGDTKLYNALAYSDSGDTNTTNFLFALYNDELMKIGLNGKAISLGKISTLSALLSKRQLFAGAIYDGYYYISGPGVDYNKIFKVKLSDKSVTEINLSDAISLLDFSFTPDGKFLHGVTDGGKLVKIDVSSGDVTFIGSAHTGYQFDSSFSDKTGRFFANDSKGNGFFEFDLTTGEKLFLSASQKATFNDGANCLKAALLFTDFGDAPLSYGTPRHNIANGVFMGHNVDHDIKSFHSINADGDDINGTDDEDGVTLLDGTDINGTTFEVDKVQDLNISVSKSAYLNAWLDFNLNGVFDSSEKIINAKHLTAGNHTISFNIPKSAKQGKKTYIRFRYSSTQNLDATQGATDGEVEDYTVVLGTKFKGIPGTFNVERVDSYKQTINSDERNAWYTQIVGKDFDYHVVFYNENITKEQELKNVPVKIELIDSNKTEGQNLIAPPHYDYFSSSSTHKSRILVTKPIYDKDLKDTIATKEAIFRVKYPAFDDGSVKPFICKKGITAEECYKQATTPKADDPVYVKYAYAQDKFAIRPEKIYVSIKDKNQTILNSKVNNTITLASGYKDYNLTVTATKYSDDTPAKGYTKLADSSIDMNITGLTCQDTSPIVEPIDFKDGLFQDLSFSHDNVGKYLLKIEDDKEWTAIDQNSSILGCIKNSSERVTDTKGKVGCDIVVNKFDTKLIFQPDHFEVNLNMSNLPKSGHPDFIYMMELNATNDNVAIQFNGKITAKSEDNTTTTNFTADCVATNILLDLNATTVSVDGTDHDIFTTDSITAVNFSRVIRFNGETNPAKFNVNNTLKRIGKILPIDSNRFLNENNGSMSLDMRYNLNKDLKQPINPVEVTFNSIEVTAPDANSSAYEKSSHIPDGNSTFKDNVKNFYFARVVSELDNYPRVNINISPLVRTPLNVDIYCYTPIDPNYCSNRNVIANSNVSGTVREQNGWYISAKHNGNLDGNVTGLSDNPHLVTISPDPTSDIALNKGANGTVNEVFNNCSKPSSTITIKTNPVLAFEPSEYTVNCTNTDPSQWTGIGQTGNVLKVQPKVNKTGKMDW